MKKTLKKGLIATFAATLACSTIGVVGVNVYNANAIENGVSGLTDFVMLADPSIRVSNALDAEGNSIGNGIRFSAEVDKAQFEALDDNGGVVTAGTFIMPYNYIKGVTGEDSLKVEHFFGNDACFVWGDTTPAQGQYKILHTDAQAFETESKVTEGETVYRINGAVVNMKEVNLAREYIGVCYIAVTTNGVTEYCLAETDELVNKRSAIQVAQDILCDTPSALEEKIAENYLETYINWYTEENGAAPTATVTTEYYVGTFAEGVKAYVKDVKYEDGKEGVYFDITQSPTSAVGEQVLSGLPNSNVDMFFSDGHTALSLQKNGYVMDITNLVKASSKDEKTISEYAEETSIYERMYEDYRDYLTTPDGKIYSVPLFMMTYNFTYDVELVQKEGLYIREDSTDENLVLTDKVEFACAGVDGVKGTEDDGLPETYAQFILWLDKLTVNTTPMHYQGGMLMRAMSNFWADFEGKDNVKACYTFDGTVMDDLVNTVNADGTVSYLQPTAITTENGYLVQRQEGRYRVLQLMETLANSMKTKNGYIYKKAFPSVENHKQAQTTYIMSKYNDDKPIVLFAEGGYWETEASTTFGKLPGGQGNLGRKFAILPTPKYSRAEVGVNSRRTVWAELGGDLFLRKGVEGAANEQAVIDFFLYYNNSANMAIENREASQPRPFDYSIDSVKDTMSNYQISLYNMLHSDRTDVVFAGDSNDFTVANSDKINNYYWLLYSNYDATSNEKSYTPVQIMYERNVTAKNFFEGLERAYTKKIGTQSEWDVMLGRVSK